MNDPETAWRHDLIYALEVATEVENLRALSPIHGIRPRPSG